MRPRICHTGYMPIRLLQLQYSHPEEFNDEAVINIKNSPFLSGPNEKNKFSSVHVGCCLLCTAVVRQITHMGFTKVSESTEIADITRGFSP